MVVKRATLYVFAARFIIALGYVHIIRIASAPPRKLYRIALCSPQERLLSGTLWRSETAQRWSQKGSVTYPIGFLPYLDAVWTPIQPLVEVNKQRDLESTETGVNILRREIKNTRPSWPTAPALWLMCVNDGLCLPWSLCQEKLSA